MSYVNSNLPEHALFLFTKSDYLNLEQCLASSSQETLHMVCFLINLIWFSNFNGILS